jgi:hypothetical protein
MQPLEPAVMLPAQEIAIDRASRWQVLRQRRPLTARAEDIHDPVDYLAHVNRAFVAASLGRRDERPDQPPFLVRQIARIAQLGLLPPTIPEDCPDH